MKICQLKVQEAATKLRPETIAQTLADLSVAQFWFQKVNAVAVISTKIKDAEIAGFYTILLYHFANYETAVDNLLMGHPPPVYSTYVEGAMVHLGPNSKPRQDYPAFEAQAVA